MRWTVCPVSHAGGVVDEEALADALINDHLGGAALDVFEVEKEFSMDNPLIKAKAQGKNIILTPHIGRTVYTDCSGTAALGISCR